MNIQEAIKERTVIHCRTEGEAIRILKMAGELGHMWYYGEMFTSIDNNWEVYEEATCYCIIEGTFGDIKYFKDANYTIINSTEITGMKKSTDWTPAPEDLLVMKQELTITAPYGFEVDEEKSTFQKIVFRKIEKKFPTELKEIDRSWFIDAFGRIIESLEECPQSPNHFTSKKSAEQALKFIKFLAFRDAIWAIEGKPENEDIDFSFKFKTPEGAAHFYKMRREIVAENL